MQKITDYRLCTSRRTRTTLPRAPPHRRRLPTCAAIRIVGYIPDMIFDKELDYLAEIGVARVALASNSVSVQLNLAQAAGGAGDRARFRAARRAGAAEGAARPHLA